MKTLYQKTLIISLLSVNSIFAQTFIQGYANVVNQCSESGILTNLTEFENLGVKTRGSIAQTNTLNWLKAKYLSYGYTNAQIVEDPFTYSGSTCKNLVVTKIGTLYPNIFVIVDAHYDTVNGPGTNDNGSGTVLLLETARLLKNIPTEYSVKFIHFSGEEDGLIGSQHYVNNVVNGTNPKMNIRLLFNIDQVGGIAGMANNTITCERDTGSPTTNNAASNTMTAQLINCVGLYSPLATTLSYAYASDYMPFENNDEVITGLFETNESTHPHSATDLLVNMDPNYLYKVTKAAIGATLHFAVANTNLDRNDFKEEDFQVSLFPNPTKEFININMGSLTETAYQFSLTDINGKVVLEKTIHKPNLIENINITSLVKGVYLATLKAGDKKINKKIMIE